MSWQYYNDSSRITLILLALQQEEKIKIYNVKFPLLQFSVT